LALSTTTTTTTTFDANKEGLVINVESSTTVLPSWALLRLSNTQFPAP